MMQVVLSTHAACGVTAFDLVLASQIDALMPELSPKWLKAESK